MKLKWMVGMLAVTMAFSAFAKDDDAAKEPAVKKVTDPVEFKALSADLEKQMSPGGRYEFVKRDERARVLADFQVIQGLLEKQATGVTLNQSEIARQITAQNEANSIFHNRDGERIVCEHVKPLGSNVPVTSCNSYAELQRIHNSSQEYMRQEQKRSPSLNGGG